jgi:PPOX class probable F420-dependent enzyme
MAYPMTDAEIRDFLTRGQRTGKVATVRADGRPHVAPVWFILDGDDVVFTTGKNTVKGKALARDPRVAIAVDLEEPPYGYVLFEGTAKLSTDLDLLLVAATAIARRYTSADEAEAFGRRNAVEGELLVRVHPTKIVSEYDLTG